MRLVKGDIKRELTWIWDWAKYLGYYAWKGIVFLTRISFKVAGFLFTVLLIETIMSMISYGRGDYR